MARRSASWHRALEAAIDTLETRSGCEWLAFDNSRLTNVPPAELTPECLLKKANHLLLPPEARAHALLTRLAKRARPRAPGCSAPRTPRVLNSRNRDPRRQMRARAGRGRRL
jgi:hypothetical protein